MSSTGLQEGGGGLPVSAASMAQKSLTRADLSFTYATVPGQDLTQELHNAVTAVAVSQPGALEPLNHHAHALMLADNTPQRKRQDISVQLKLQIIQYAHEHGISAAMKQWGHLRLQRAQLKNWMSLRHQLEQANPDRQRVGPGRQPVYINLERDLLDWVKMTGETSRSRIHDKARELATDMTVIANNPGLEQFKCSMHWVANFMRRAGLMQGGSDDELDGQPRKKRRGRPPKSRDERLIGMPHLHSLGMANLASASAPTAAPAQEMYRSTRCDVCNMIVHDLEAHYSTECPEAHQILSCPYSCGQELQRRHLVSHFHECPCAQVQCPFQTYGCTAELTRQELDSHLEEDVTQHVELVRAAHQKLQDKLEFEREERRREVTGLQEELKSFKESLSEIESLAGILMVHVHLPDRTKVSVKIRSSDQVQTLKDKICRLRPGLSMDRHILLSGEGEISGADTLESKGIKDHHILVLKPRDSVIRRPNVAPHFVGVQAQPPTATVAVPRSQQPSPTSTVASPLTGLRLQQAQSAQLNPGSQRSVVDRSFVESVLQRSSTSMQAAPSAFGATQGSSSFTSGTNSALVVATQSGTPLSSQFASSPGAISSSFSSSTNPASYAGPASSASSNYPPPSSASAGGYTSTGAPAASYSGAASNSSSYSTSVNSAYGGTSGNSSSYSGSNGNSSGYSANPSASYSSSSNSNYSNSGSSGSYNTSSSGAAGSYNSSSSYPPSSGTKAHISSVHAIMQRSGYSDMASSGDPLFTVMDIEPRESLRSSNSGQNSPMQRDSSHNPALRSPPHTNTQTSSPHSSSGTSSTVNGASSGHQVDPSYFNVLSAILPR